MQRFNAYFRKPRLAPPEVDGFPAEFRDRPQFAVFKVDLRENDRGELKWSKVPYNPTTGRRAASDDPATWATLAAAVAAYLTGQYDGIGYFLAEDEGVLFFDLDKSRDEGGGLKPWAAEIVRDLDSFAEYSVTGGGVHVFVRGRKPVERCRPHRDLDPGLEIYGRRRFIALTGLRLPDTPAEIMPRQLAVGQIFARYFPPPSAPAPAPVASTAWVSDDDRLAAGRRSQELGPILQQLYDSDDWAGYRSHSDAVAALANALAFLFGPDPEAVRRQLFASALVRTSRKWQQRGEYLADRAVDLALRNRTSFYQGRPMPAATVPLRDQPAPAGRPATSFKMPEPVTKVERIGDRLPWLYRGYLARGLKTLFVAFPKCGKTTWLVLLLSALCRGVPFCGIELASARAVVLTEEPLDLWLDRRDTLGLTDAVRVSRSPFMGAPKAAEWEAYLGELDGYCEREGVGLVVFDTITKFWPVEDENDAGQVIRAFGPLDKLTDKGVAVLVVHHPRKSDGGEGTAARGSGAFSGSVDVVMELRRHNAGKRCRSIKTYSRLPAPEEFVIELSEDGKSYSARENTKPRAQTQDDNAAAIAGILAGGPKTANDVVAAWPGEKPSASTAGRWLSAGTDAGRWTRAGAGTKSDPFRYSLA